MRFWLRQAVLNLDGSRYTLDDLNFKFKITFEDRPMLSVLQLEVYNLSPSKRASLSKGAPVVISAGYKGDIGTVFVGSISSYETDSKTPDNTTKIIAADSLEQWLGTYINKTYQGPITAQQILDDLLNIFGIEVAMVKLAINRQYPRGRVCNGKLKDILTQIACGDCKSRLIIRCGQIIINPPDEGIQSGFLLTASTGLLQHKTTSEGQDTATMTNAAAATTREAQNSPTGNITRTCLLNYRIGCADLVAIRDSEISGAYRVVKGSHEGDRSGSWITTLEVVPA